jgi:hypothetical protein
MMLEFPEEFACQRFYGHAGQVPSRPPDHQLPVRHGHDVQRPNRDLRLFATVCESGVDEAEP